MAVFAWTRGLAHRAKLDSNADLETFCTTLENVCVESIEAGQMTKDLALLVHGDKMSREHYLETVEYLDVLGQNLQTALAKQ